MKTFTSIAAAALAGATLLSASATGASAGGWDDGDGWYRHRGYHQPHVVYRDRRDDGGALVAGAFLGLALGALATEPQPVFVEPEPVLVEPEPAPYLPPPHPNYTFAEDQHVAWCSQTYRSYNAERDTFFDFQGVERRCITPDE